MTVLTISSLDSAKDRLSQFVAGDRKLIGVGIVLPDGKPEPAMKVALLDVTDEVKQGHLDTNNPGLVNAFIHSHQEEIRNKINETLIPSSYRVASIC
jgi:hypothetical protein